MSAQTANIGTVTRVRPAVPYFWWLREAQVQAGVTTVRPKKDVAAELTVVSTARSSAA